MTDLAVMHEAAKSLLEVLKVGAVDAEWTDATYEVTAGEPSYDCQAIFVWVDQIVPEIGPGGCVTASEVRFRYAISDCVGADIDEEEIIASAPDHHAAVWAIWVALVTDCCSASSIVGVQADTVRVETMSQLTTSGGVAVWSGTVTAILSPA